MMKKTGQAPKKPGVDTKKVEAAEIAGMKRGVSSKALVTHRAEHKAMGMKNGGKVGSMKKAGC